MTWNIYQGTNGSLPTIQWTLLNHTHLYDGVWFYGKERRHLPFSYLSARFDPSIVLLMQAETRVI